MIPMASAAEKHVAFVGAYIMPDVTPRRPSSDRTGESRG